MRNFLIGLVLFFAGLAAIMLIPSPQEPAPMPWEITVMPDGNIEVFDIHIGTTTYRQAQQQLKQYGETAIFSQEGKIPDVEAYFNSINLGGLSAKLVLNLAAEQDQITEMMSTALEARLQPSGAHQYELSNEANNQLIDAIVLGITYIPSVKLNHDMLRHRFGEPNKVETIEASETELWLYDDKQLSIRVNPHEKTILQYNLKTP